jgi:hypothetical protein
MRKILLNSTNKNKNFGQYIALVDDEDYLKVSKFNWCKAGDYAQSSLNGKVILMHRLVMGYPKGLQIDHINHDGLNNQKQNLRLATHSQNIANTRKSSPHSSRFIGVCLVKKTGMFQSSISFQGKRYHLGNFKDEHQAGLMYDFWASFFFKDFAVTNFKVINPLLKT